MMAAETCGRYLIRQTARHQSSLGVRLQTVRCCPLLHLNHLLLLVVLGQVHLLELAH